MGKHIHYDLLTALVHSIREGLVRVGGQRGLVSSSSSQLVYSTVLPQSLSLSTPCVSVHQAGKTASVITEWHT